MDEQGNQQRIDSYARSVKLMYPGMDMTAKIAKDVMAIHLGTLQGMLENYPEAIAAYTQKYKSEIGAENVNAYLEESKKYIKRKLIDTIQADLQTKYESGGQPRFDAMRKAISQKKDTPNDIKFEVRQWIDAYQVQYESGKTASEKEYHDKEERGVAMAVLNGQFADAIDRLRGNNFLKPDEILKWQKAIETLSKEGKVIDADKASAEIVMINRMIRQGKNRNEIINHIVQNPNLLKGDKEQYINKVEADWSREIQEGLNRGEKWIEDIIIPKRSPMSKLLKAPVETRAVRKSQDALYFWIEEQQKLGKPPSIDAIIQKAKELAEANKPSMQQIIEDMIREQTIQGAGQ